MMQQSGIYNLYADVVVLYNQIREQFPNCLKILISVI